MYFVVDAGSDFQLYSLISRGLLYAGEMEEMHFFVLI